MVAYPSFLKPAEEFLKLLRRELRKILQAKLRERCKANFGEYPFYEVG
jgi:hypothetical protein